MNRILKSGFLFLLGFVMLGWFVYSISDASAISETYTTDRMMDVVRLIGAIAGFAGAIMELRR